MFKSNTFSARPSTTYNVKGKSRLLQRHRKAVDGVVAEANALVQERDRLLGEISDNKLRETATR